MSTTYYISDKRYLRKRICSIHSTALGSRGAILDVPIEVIERYPDNTTLKRDNGIGASNIGELKEILQDCIKVSYKQALGFCREEIKDTLSRFPDTIFDNDGKKYNMKYLKEIAQNPDSDLRDLFKDE
jgi:hypothetical protein